MQAAIVASAFMLGLAGAPHCTAMCAVPCAVVAGRDGAALPTAAFHAARIAGYACTGAAAAAGLAALGTWGQMPWLRPFWALVHAGLLALGVWLVWQGRQPAWLAGVGRTRAAAPAPAEMPWQPVHLTAVRGRDVARSARAGLAGSLWFAWPCGLLQSALLVAALSNSAAGGALAMGVFAVASSAGLLAVPLARPLVEALAGRAGAPGFALRFAPRFSRYFARHFARKGPIADRWALRAAGALMAALSAWALGAGLWQRIAQACA
jgi:sulfite exporter TauE/SafE